MSREVPIARKVTRQPCLDPTAHTKAIADRVARKTARPSFASMRTLLFGLHSVPTVPAHEEQQGIWPCGTHSEPSFYAPPDRG